MRAASASAIEVEDDMDDFAKVDGPGPAKHFGRGRRGSRRSDWS